LTKTQKQIQSEQTKQKIIESAIDLFSKKGFNFTSIADIANSTGITKGAIYHHFENKDAIFYAVLEGVRHLWREKVLRDLLGKSNAIDRLTTLFENHACIIEEQENICLVLSGLVMEMDNVNDEFISALEEIFSDLTLLIERIIERGQKKGEIRTDLESHLIALNLVGIMEGSAIPWILNRTKISYNEYSRTQTKIVINGLKP